MARRKPRLEVPAITRTMRREHARGERIVRGFSNRRRIAVLHLLQRHPGLSMSEIAVSLRATREAAWEHLRKMTAAGLLVRRRKGNLRLHRLTARGRRVLRFLKQLE